MLRDKPVLIIEDNVYLALDLCAAIEQLEGRPVGPVYTVAEALVILHTEPIAAAVVDCELLAGEGARLTTVLAEKGVPFVVQSTANNPPELAEVCLGAPVVVKPIRPQEVVCILAHEVAKTP